MRLLLLNTVIPRNGGFEGGNKNVNLVFDPNMILNKMKHFLRFFLLLVSGSTYAQLGVNTTNPHPASVMDITPDLINGNMGVLLPRVTTAQRLNPKVPPTDRLLVYDTQLNMFMYYLGGQWYALNAIKTTITDRNGSKDTLSKHVGTAVFQTSKVDSNAVIVNGNMKVNGKVVGNLTSTGYVRGEKLFGEGATPVGAIMMWSGNPSTLPKGWALCDGTNGTPNLTGRFIVGYDPNDADYNATQKTGPNFTDADGTSDGTNTQDAKQVRLLSTQSGLPSHGHDVDEKPHSHGYTDIFRNDGYAGGDKGARGGFTASEDRNTTLTSTGLTIKNSTQQNASTSIENRPPYYVLAYIIKLNY